MTHLTPDLIRNTYDAIRDATIRTPLVPATRLSLHLGIDLHLKLENLQHTNAFKARGALAKLLTLTEAQKRAGVIACSAGNHAQGVAYHATRLGIASTIVMPEGTPFNKVKRTEDFGATVILHGTGFDSSVQFTLDLAARDGLTFLHPFDDPVIAAGQGTVALEMLEQAPDLDCIVVPIGGGGLIAGMAVAAKAIKPEIEFIGAQAQLFDAAKAQFDGAPTNFDGATLAEGIAVKEPSAANLAVIKQHVTRIDSATEAEIEDAVFDLLSAEKLVAEGAPGAGLAVIKNNLAAYAGKKVGLVVCGGNIDSRLLSTLILRGLVRDGRITRLTFEISDTPGQLADISRIIGEAGANVVEVIHQRMMQSVSLKQAELDVVIEARDLGHVEMIVGALRSQGFSVRSDSGV
ncbi:threonine ammonia-lyase [Thalassorhabdomicrobium marinisediminis]|uniref:L-serine dehydratase n=1 Tax=Thalassorhabdomicrobium marinisediminis TaxID=2170577 RepID=A0A2T7FWB7_9RHOB|nr:threonine ammonia-lyase [Thalassorhabdomicrobium marinisediminis]PVA06444.1 threonine ammonia-lyase [Thalassorhabdomicrobium marinisediminis]